jgi:hypothetical protein
VGDTDVTFGCRVRSAYAESKGVAKGEICGWIAAGGRWSDGGTGKKKDERSRGE